MPPSAFETMRRAHKLKTLTPNPAVSSQPMNRLGRFISAIAAALSLLICVATLLLWSRSYRAFDQLSGVAYG